MTEAPPRRGGLRRRTEEGTFDGPFTVAARWLLARGVHPNHFTFAQAPVFGFMIWSALEGHAWTFFALSWFVILLDGGDGILARTGNLQSRAGAILDATFDTVGIAVVLFGAALFFPEYQWWMLALFVGNGLLFLQNALLETKVVSYVRGPIIVAVAWPQAIHGSLFAACFTVAWLLLARARLTLRRLFATNATGSP
ncbi:MAG: CDP-alcohol phosphatidyltransferase family protein [Thermoplasmatota archaeon]